MGTGMGMGMDTGWGTGIGSGGDGWGPGHFGDNLGTGMGMEGDNMRTGMGTDGDGWGQGFGVPADLEALQELAQVALQLGAVGDEHALLVQHIVSQEVHEGELKGGSGVSTAPCPPQPPHPSPPSPPAPTLSPTNQDREPRKRDNCLSFPGSCSRYAGFSFSCVTGWGQRWGGTPPDPPRQQLGAGRTHIPTAHPIMGSQPQR